ARDWYRVWLSADPASGRLVLGYAEIAGTARTQTEAVALGFRMSGAGCVLIGAEDPDRPRHHFTGNIEDPALLSGFIAARPDALSTLTAQPAPLLAGWDFGHDIGGIGVVDIGPQACHGEVINMPTRAVVGARWTGRETCWRHAPQDYAAIHFHADDLSDCR